MRAGHASSTSSLQLPSKLLFGTNAMHPTQTDTAKDDRSNNIDDGGEDPFRPAANWRRHSADDTRAACSHTLPPRTSADPIRRTYPAGASRLERMLPELFYVLAEQLFADPVALVRVSHLSRRMRDQLSEMIWRQACRFWDAHHLPKGWFSNWHDFFILFVCPTRFPKLQVLHVKGCATCHVACPVTGRFRNNDRGLVPEGWEKRNFLKLHLSETSRQRFDYSRNGNLLYCPECKHKQRLPDDQDERCTLCSSPTPSAYVQFRVVLSRDVMLRRQAEKARDRALASFGSAAAAAAWAVTTTTTTTTTTTSADTVPRKHASTATDHATARPPASSTTAVPSSATSSSASSSASLPDRYHVADDPATAAAAAAATTTPTKEASADATSTPSMPHRPPPVPFTLGTTARSSAAAYEDYDEGRPTFWAQIWNDTVRCAQGIRFHHGRPAFIDSQASLCGDCVHTLARLGYGRLEVAVRHEGTWALSSER
ncbi:hypothetical protein SYNPS1DRAFT_31056 [Syncephalis pseudoplumigaleata]|uniref:Uncharacterized protein n=1 Tax=Syncephalis pseudoplumigaleata TaxID=1712513 RepID=A0A4P9YTC5_9FUNG|nr:hypothetical protein SYNPS1DRAFT_31056 [Syncephalis pseudoplumigaleata]|eukprot:RKP23233.1 hypothetical protein SYNPS1DRAFT_31056 [Syncephalis pseudoplumigaleata]